MSVRHGATSKSAIGAEMPAKTIAGYIYSRVPPCGLQYLTTKEWKELRDIAKARGCTEKRVSGDLQVRDRKGVLVFEIYKETKS